MSYSPDVVKGIFNIPNQFYDEIEKAAKAKTFTRYARVLGKKAWKKLGPIKEPVTKSTRREIPNYQTLLGAY